MSATLDAKDIPNKRRATAAVLTVTTLFACTAVLLHIPFGLALFSQNIQFQPAQFMTEYSKLLGSSAMSVVIAFGWKRFDRSQHLRFAKNACELASERLTRALPLLNAILATNVSCYGTDADLTARALQQEKHLADCSSLGALLAGIRPRLESLAQEARNHIQAFDRSVVLLADALLRHERHKSVATATTVQHAVGAMLETLGVGTAPAERV